MGERDERDVWVAQTSRHIETVLSGRYTPAECEALAKLLYDLPRTSAPGGMSPEAIVLERLLLLQGLEPSTAHILALAIPRLDLDRLLVASNPAADLLGISRVTLGRHRRSGALPADVEQGTEQRLETVAYRLDRLLRVISTDRHRDVLTGGPGHVRFGPG